MSAEVAVFVGVTDLHGEEHQINPHRVRISSNEPGWAKIWTEDGACIEVEVLGYTAEQMELPEEERGEPVPSQAPAQSLADAFGRATGQAAIALHNSRLEATMRWQARAGRRVLPAGVMGVS